MSFSMGSKMAFLTLNFLRNLRRAFLKKKIFLSMGSKMAFLLYK